MVTLQLALQLPGFSVTGGTAKPPASECAERRQQVAAVYMGILCHLYSVVLRGLLGGGVVPRACTQTLLAANLKATASLSPRQDR